MLRIISKNLSIDIENINCIEFSPAGFGKIEINFKTGNPVTIYKVDPAFEDLEKFLCNELSPIIESEEGDKDVYLFEMRTKNGVTRKNYKKLQDRQK